MWKNASNIEAYRPKKKFLALIPARAGSKGLPGKNIKLLHGKPLLAHTIELARATGCFEKIVVSTDGSEIAEVARRFGAEVLERPAELAADTTAMLPVIQHALRETQARGWNPDFVALLQPTSPLRTREQVTEAVRLADEQDPDSVVSVTELPKHLSPDCLMRVQNGRLQFFTERGNRIFRRQDAETAYLRNGTIYLSRASTLLEKNSIYGEDSVPLLMREEDSSTIDTQEDWDRAEAILRSRQA